MSYISLLMQVGTNTSDGNIISLSIDQLGRLESESVVYESDISTITHEITPPVASMTAGEKTGIASGYISDNINTIVDDLNDQAETEIKETKVSFDILS